MSAGIPVIPIVGVNLTKNDAVQDRALGTAQIDNLNQTWVYVSNPGAAVPAVTDVVLTEPGNTIAAGTGNYTADYAFGAATFGWVRKTVSPL